MTTFRLAQWWQPGDPQRRIAGTLFEAEPGIFRLHLDGHFGPPEEPERKDGKPRPVNPPLDDLPMLLGTTTQGKLITLIDCRVLRASGLPGLTNTFQEVAPRLIAYDVHFPSRDEFRLNSLSLRYSNLDLWVATSGFSVSFSAESTFGVSVAYQKPARVSAKLSSGLTVSIAFSASGPELRHPQTELRIEQKAWLDVSAAEERSYDELLRTVTMVSDLIALGIGKPLVVAECEATAFELGAEEKPPKSIRFSLHHNAEPISPALGDADRTELLFSLSDVRERFESIVEAWCVRPEATKPLYSLYFGTLRSSRMYVEHRFLNMFQALETFHRRVYVPSEASVREHAERIERIINSVQDAKDRKWLKRPLRYSHEPAAADRIRYLVAQYNAEWIFNDVEKDIELAANFRNFYTHYDVKLKEKLPPLEEQPRAMHNLAARFQLLCELILLREIGLESEMLKSRFRESQRLERRLVRD